MFVAFTRLRKSLQITTIIGQKHWNGNAANEVKGLFAWPRTPSSLKKNSGKNRWENTSVSWRMQVHSDSVDGTDTHPPLPVNSLVMALFCRRAEQMSSSQGGRNSWWLARSSAMVLGEPGAERCSPSPSWRPSSTESTSRKRDCCGGLMLSRGRRMHLGENVRVVIFFCILNDTKLDISKADGGSLKIVSELFGTSS